MIKGLRDPRPLCLVPQSSTRERGKNVGEKDIRLFMSHESCAGEHPFLGLGRANQGRPRTMERSIMAYRLIRAFKADPDENCSELVSDHSSEGSLANLTQEGCKRSGTFGLITKEGIYESWGGGGGCTSRRKSMPIFHFSRRQ